MNQNYSKELVEAKENVLDWINSQHSAITITEFEWFGYKLKMNTRTNKIEVLHEEFNNWNSALNRILEALVR